MTQTAPHSSRKPFTDSMYAMWRCVIAVAHADGIIHAKERELFDKVFASLERSYALTEAQSATFMKDLAQKQDINLLLPGITDPECKASLLFFAQIVASVDGTLAYDEATLVGRLHGKLGSMPDTRDRVTEIRDQMKSLSSGGGRDPIYFALDALLTRLGAEPVE